MEPGNHNIFGKERFRHEVDMSAEHNQTAKTCREEIIDPDRPIYVTQPSLPPLEEFIPYLEKIWETKTLTNGGPFHRELEKKLSQTKHRVAQKSSSQDAKPR